MKIPFQVIDEILEEDGKGAKKTIIMGAEKKPHRSVFGQQGLGRRKQRVRMLIDFCETNKMLMINRLFRKAKKSAYAWKEQRDCSRHQMAFIPVKHQYRKSTKGV
jgi:nicotinic acid mononucleotide adenylyltransferase